MFVQNEDNFNEYISIKEKDRKVERNNSVEMQKDEREIISKVLEYL